MDGRNWPSGLFKEMTMSSMKTILAAASLAVLSAVGIGSASAQAWDRHGDHHSNWVRHERFEHGFVDRMRLTRALLRGRGCPLQHSTASRARVV